MLHSYGAGYSNVVIRPLEEKDIETIRRWRNDTSQTKFLRDVGHITSQMQLEWYNNYLKDESQVIFAIDEVDELNRMVGSLAVYNINPNEHTAEIGKIQIGDPAAHGKGIGRVSLVMAMKIAIRLMGIEKILGGVSRDNVQAYTNDMRVGFRIVGEHISDNGIVEADIELDESDLFRANDYYESIEVSDNWYEI